MNIKDEKTSRLWTFIMKGEIMSKADEMFEKLGYEKNLHINKKEQVWGEYWIENKHCKKISFDYIDKEICVSANYDYEALYFNIQELQAINKKCEELGWLERN